MIEQETTNQDSKVTPPELRNPTGRGGFSDHPENRSDGRWRKEDSFTYWMNYFKKMSLIDFKNAREEMSGDTWTVAMEAAYVRVEQSLGKELQNFEAVADRTEGKAPQTIRYEGGLFSNNKLEMVIVDANQIEPEAAANPGASEQSTNS